ncbi:MAG TPA: YbhB/YbcL family Raf kinase inhibitor-like protein [Candidatus Acidoferrales bacterium]|nr:YbhB/YbcL family Raf kinase inhibitor-like protein [Candidatus Acidoferrales bacterium]
MQPESVFGLALLLLAASVVHGADSKTANSMQLKSPAFQNGADVPRKHTCDAENISPLLRWQKAPAGTKAFALIVDDPDAPGGVWVHWVIYDLPADAKELTEGTAKTETLANGAKQGVNDFRRIGYSGPCPPPGSTHRYFFRLYALDSPTKLKPRATKQQVLDAMKGHVLAEAELVGRYKR